MESKMLWYPSKQMDPKIWSRMPEDLLERVLSFLPLKNFMSLRSTCRHFNSLVFSPPFISKYSPSSSPSPSAFSSFFLLSHPQFSRKYPLFDTVHNNWRNLSVSLSAAQPCGSTSALLSSSNGLLCFSHPTSNSFVISNLLSRSSRVVKFPVLPFSFESITLVSMPNGNYKILVIKSSMGSSKTTFIYDSSFHSWEQSEDFDLIFSNYIHHQEGVSHHGSLYFITPEPFHVLCFDFQIGKWKRATIDLPADLSFARLVSDGDGTLFLIGGIGRNGISKSMRLWEWNGDEERWIDVEDVPEMMCKKFLSVCYHNYEHVYCFWHQGLVCVCCYTWPEILYFKVSRKTWHWLPKCPSLPPKWSCGFKWFSFVPELYAFV
nr:F-box/kelch-repeat protein At5g43190 [Ipomoea batatas]